VIRDPTSLYQGDISPRTEKAARTISAVGSPFSLSILLFVALGLRIEDPFLRLGSIVACISLAVVLPLAVVRHYSRKFDNRDGDIYRREDRRNPIMIGVACYLLCLAALYAMIGLDLLTVMLVCYMVSTLLVGLVSLRWKISIHATGVVGPAIGLAVAYPPYGGLLILVLPLVAWSRYVMKKHTPLQLVAGAALGAAVTLTVFSLLL
jgi:membrane-associated phospholipid phosphatase